LANLDHFHREIGKNLLIFQTLGQRSAFPYGDGSRADSVNDLATTHGGPSGKPPCKSVERVRAKVATCCLMRMPPISGMLNTARSICSAPLLVFFQRQINNDKTARAMRMNTMYCRVNVPTDNINKVIVGSCAFRLENKMANWGTT